MTAPRISVLFTSAGRRVELINCFRRAAAALGRPLVAHACDMDPERSAACRSADHSFAVPACSAPDYIDRLLAYCEANRIGLLIPTIDPELLPLALNRERFAQVGTQVHVSAPEVVEIARDKLRTAQVLGAAGVPVPRTARAEAARSVPQEWSWPLFVKPSGGSASRGLCVAESAAQIRADYAEPMIAQELLEGPEYTVNIYVGRDGRLLSAIPHLRMSVRAGEVEKGRTVRDPRLMELAAGVAAGLPGAHGVMCFQVIDDRKRGPLVFEINARFGGGYPLADHAGGRFAESLLSLVTGGAELASGDWREGATMLRYDAAVFDG